MTSLLGICIFLGLSILCLVFLYVFLMLLRGCFHIFIPKSWGDGIKGRPFVLSLGITAVLFSDTTNQVIRGASNIFLESMRAFGDSVSRTLSLLMIDPTALDDVEVLRQDFTGVYSTVINQSLGLIYSVSFPALLAAFAVFVLLANALSAQANGGDSSQLVRVINWYKALDPMRRSRLTLGMAVLLGAYLSIAAVLSIPWLYDIDEPNPQEEGLLRVRLDSTAMPKDDWEEQWNKDLFEPEFLQPITQALDAVAVGKQSNTTATAELAAATTTQQVGADITLVTQDYVKNVKQRISSLESNWTSLKDEASKRRKRALESAISAYKSYRDKNLSDRERQKFQDDLVNWYSNQVQNIDKRMSYFLSGVRWEKAELRRWAVEAGNSLRRGNSPRSPYIDEDYDVGDAMLDYSEPPSPRNPSNIGIFGISAQWLIDTRSYTIALLFGMIGFGLVGSAVSRSLSPLQKDASIVSSRGTFDVMLVGVSASIIIFLASQGGLAIFASGETQPNGYILFLAALLGAAYGDRVWEAARERFFEQLKGQDSTPRDKADSSKKADDSPEAQG
ncbi:MAG: hypothetical protein GY938_27510 [Ketobacter sp.]|nr:hypothetical protein [Ketobacter sp.]